MGPTVFSQWPWWQQEGERSVFACPLGLLWGSSDYGDSDAWLGPVPRTDR